MNTPETPIVLPLKEDLREMRAQILSPTNVQETEQEVHHPPTPSECAWHFISHGGVEAFRRTHQIAA